MATSPYDDTVYILDFLGQLIHQKTASLLDVGAGFGRWGFLCRCHMANGESLTEKKDQGLRIDAVEGFKGNISPLYDCVYDVTHVGNAMDVVPGLGDYDVVICSHMIEHLAKEDGQKLIQEMRSHAKVAVIIALPLGDWPQDSIGGNHLEIHQSTWSPSDFKDGSLVKRFGKEPLSSGVVIYPVSNEAKWHVKTMGSFLRSFAFDKCPALMKLLGAGKKW